tara:strand:+ start:5777 stop:6541 length:765 start_codon:yes stop_codon:yes gene_type:complete
MTYSEQLEVIKTIKIKEGDRRIVSCPFCGGPKKLSISKIDNTIMWNCFRASCDAKGICSGKPSAEYIKNCLNGIVRDKPLGRPLPEITTSIENNSEAISYLKSVNSYEAHTNSLINIRYAPAENRVLFYYRQGAVGRLLAGYQSKWVSYGNIGGSVLVGSGTNVVMVEDVPSACSVSRLPNCAGLALLGTKIPPNIVKTLKDFTKRFLILDNDAALNSLKEARRCGNDIQVRLTNKDLKLLSSNDIQKLLDMNS